MDMGNSNAAIVGFSLRLLALSACKYCVSFFAAWLFVWGTAIIILRFVWRLEAIPLLLGMAGLIPLAAVAIYIARRRLPDISAITALLDKVNDCGGLLMAQENFSIGKWDDQIRTLQIPSLSWRGGRNCSVLLAGAIYVTVAMLVPQQAIAGPSHSLAIDQKIGQLSTQIEAMKEENIIDISKANEFQDKLDDIRKVADGDDPAKTLEAIDHASAELSKLANQAAEHMKDLANKADNAQEAASAMSENIDKMDPVAKAQEMEELAELVKQACQSNAQEGNELGEQLAKTLADSGKELTPEQKKQLKEMLDKSNCDAGQMLKELAKCNKGGCLTKQQLEEISKLMSKKKGDCKICIGKMAKKGLIDAGDFESEITCNSPDEKSGQPGRGGVSRGRGDAAMSWQDPSSTDGAKFKEKELPPASLTELKDSQLMGVTFGDPANKDSAGNDGQGAGATAAGTPGGGNANNQAVLPKHRGAVRKYFDRESGGK